MKRKALVTGITGQDGAYLAKFLLDRGYQVFGAHRRSASASFWRLVELGIYGDPSLILCEMDLTDMSSCLHVIQTVRPAEIYNLAAQSFVGTSFTQPRTTAEITGIGVVNLLEALRHSNTAARFYQASTSEMFGLVQAVPQTESTPFYPRSPYGCSKLFAHWTTINYQESYGLFASSGILFNHESPLRGEEFVTRKITMGVSRLSKGGDEPLFLGNLDAKRDWGFAGDYVVGMHAMLQVDEPGVYVLATNECRTVREFLSAALQAAGLDAVFEGSNEAEICVERSTGRVLAKVDPRFYRPAEVDLLIGDYSKARHELAWKPETTFNDLVQMMVASDLRRQ